MPPNLPPPIPALFLERMKSLLEDEYAAFAAALEEEPVSGLRVNTLKLPAEAFRAISPLALGETVPWAPEAYILPAGTREREPGKHPFHLAGLYYLQDPSAMAAAPLLMGAPFDSRQGLAALRPASAQGMRVLDLAAAPGGKTTALAALMQGDGLLVANEIKDKRVGHLAANVERWGAGNVIITNELPERLADHFGAFFDRVLVDAPCSGEGMFRKEASARRDWSPEMVAGCAIRQGNILRVAAKLVRPGGYLLYSTCTFAPEEDEQVIAHLLEEFPEYEVWPLPDVPGWMRGRPDWLVFNTTPKDRGQAVTKYSKDDELKKAVRLFPHRIKGEGHFVCLLKRSAEGGGETNWRPDRLALPTRVQVGLWQAFAGGALEADFAEARLRVRNERLYLAPEDLPDFGNLRVVHPGVWLGTFKKERFEPAHPLALFLQRGQALNVLNLSSEDAGERRSPLQAYLAGETIRSDGTPGWTLVTVEAWPLGWGKRVQGMLKNHYPKGWQVYS